MTWRKLVLLQIILIGITGVRMLAGWGPVESVTRTITQPLISVLQNSIREPVAITADAPILVQSTNITTDQSSQDAIFSVVQLELTATSRRAIVALSGAEDLGVAVREGSAFMAGDWLYGRVQSVNGRFATVILPGDPTLQLTAGTANSSGVVRSEAGSLRYDLSIADEQVNSVITSDGVDGQLSPGIPIGVILERIDTDNGPYAQYAVGLGYQLERVSEVTVWAP